MPCSLPFRDISVDRKDIERFGVTRIMESKKQVLLSLPVLGRDICDSQAAVRERIPIHTSQGEVHRGLVGASMGSRNP